MCALSQSVSQSISFDYNVFLMSISVCGGVEKLSESWSKSLKAFWAQFNSSFVLDQME